MSKGNYIGGHTIVRAPGNQHARLWNATKRYKYGVKKRQEEFDKERTAWADSVQAKLAKAGEKNSPEERARRKREYIRQWEVRHNKSLTKT